MTDGHAQQQEHPLDRRTGDRQISVLINAGISHEGRDALCRIRNLSSGGVMIECVLPLAVDDVVSLHLRSGDEIGGLVRWVRDGKAGIAFDDPGSSALVSGTKVAPGSGIGHPLFRRCAWAGLSAGHKRERVAVAMISPAGMIVETGRDWGQERLLTVSIDGLGEHVTRMGGIPPGGEEDRIALLFVQPLHYRAFNEWLMTTPSATEPSPEGALVAERQHWA